MEHDEDVDREGAKTEDAEAWSLLAGALDPARPASELRERLLAELRREERFSPFVSEVASAFALTEDAVREAFASMLDPHAWRPGRFPGSEAMSTPALRAVHAVIVRVPVGTRIASHGHQRRELTYVLDGEITESGTRRLGPGDLLEAAVGSEHDLVIGGEGPCLVVLALP